MSQLTRFNHRRGRPQANCTGPWSSQWSPCGWWSRPSTRKSTWSPCGTAI